MKDNCFLNINYNSEFDDDLNVISYSAEIILINIETDE
jgi:hypothetical protein